GNLAQELSGQSEVFRDRINHIFSDWEAQFTDCLGTAYKTGEIVSTTKTTELAAFILSGWQGAILKAKLAQSTAPMRTFSNTLFNTVLRSDLPTTTPQ
ncbi:MAG: TetR family transcriptional regulator C-terminal domain-containing protein, partial [Cyanobacteria bacterium J06555_13]